MSSIDQNIINQLYSEIFRTYKGTLLIHSRSTGYVSEYEIYISGEIIIQGHFNIQLPADAEEMVRTSTKADLLIRYEELNYKLVSLVFDGKGGISIKTGIPLPFHVPSNY